MRVWDNEPDETLEVNILPMIDVIFAILAFFIVSTLFLTRAEGLPVNLPSATTATPQVTADFTVTLEVGGNISLDRQPIALEELAAAIAASLPADATPTITIQADAQASHGQVIAVMDALRALEGAILAIATDPQPLKTDE